MTSPSAAIPTSSLPFHPVAPWQPPLLHGQVSYFRLFYSCGSPSGEQATPVTLKAQPCPLLFFFAHVKLCRPLLRGGIPRRLLSEGQICLPKSGVLPAFLLSPTPTWHCLVYLPFIACPSSEDTVKIVFTAL